MIALSRLTKQERQNFGYHSIIWGVWFYFLDFIHGSSSTRERTNFVYWNSFTFFIGTFPGRWSKWELRSEYNSKFFRVPPGVLPVRYQWLGNKKLKTNSPYRKKGLLWVIFLDYSTFPLRYVDSTAYYINNFKIIIPSKTKIYLFPTSM